MSVIFIFHCVFFALLALEHEAKNKANVINIIDLVIVGFSFILFSL
ncbi:membrane protein [Candidatus Magnetoovum chiemensis]|nr:membrane protein [Candidatus Magnetoovum chiemensis]